jgi:hypothetical protein
MHRRSTSKLVPIDLIRALPRRMLRHCPQEAQLRQQSIDIARGELRRSTVGR